MKKIFATLFMITAIASTSVFAQTANDGTSVAPAEKKISVQNVKRSEVKKKIMSSDNPAAAKKKAKAIRKAKASGEDKETLQKRYMKRKNASKGETSALEPGSRINKIGMVQGMNKGSGQVILRKKQFRTTETNQSNN